MKQVKKWQVFQLDLKTQSLYDEEYGIPVKAEFSCEDRVYNINGFWRGGGFYSVRFCPDKAGVWQYKTESEDEELCVSGSFACVEDGTTKGFIRKDSDHPYHFKRDDGSNYFMFGTTYYHLSRVHDNDWKECIDGSANAGFTKIRLHCGGTPGLSKERDFFTANFVYDWVTRIVGSGFSPYHTESFEIYENLDRIVEYMQQKGMVADIIMVTLEGRTLRKTDQRHFKYLIDRYAAYTNVIWCLCNEWNYHTPVDLDYFVNMGKLVKENDPYNKYNDNQRLVSLHQKTMIDFLCFDKDFASHAIVQYGVRNGRVTANDEWADVDANNVRYTFGDDWGSQSIIYNYGHNMPVVNDEWGYIGEHEDRSEPQNEDGSFKAMTREKHRRIMWSVYLSGGYGSSGDKYLHKSVGCRPYFACKWADCKEYEDTKFFKEFFSSIPYWKLVPIHQNNIGNRVYASAIEDECYLIYCADGGDISLDAKGMSNAEIYDLSAPQNPESLKLDENFKISLPKGKDYLIYLHK